MKLSFNKLNKDFFIAHKEHFKMIGTATLAAVTVICVFFRLVPHRQPQMAATVSQAVPAPSILSYTQQPETAASQSATAPAQTGAESTKVESQTNAKETETAAQTDATKAAATTAAPTTAKVTVPFATAIIPDYPADYDSQWDEGYLIAIDNPDYSYQCAPVTLTDEDRDLLERLCNGEFGSGGFVGASLIAQSVKDAMCFDGYQSVQAVITGCRYDGRTDRGTTEACRQAVRYIFDENHDAVQHRIMYMYNPVLVQSAFHESQNYIMTYQDVRFFDRWNY